jgi:hypothetical protein
MFRIAVSSFVVSEIAAGHRWKEERRRKKIKSA